LLLTLGVFACASATNAPSEAPAPAVSGAATAAVVGNSNDVKWARASAEHRAIYLETYRAAAARLETLAASRQQGAWAVILDADETVLDNSEYEAGRIPFGGSFDSRTWALWVAEGRATALPGAVWFTNRVHELGGKVVIVTNRSEAQCPITRANLQRVSIPADMVLCKTATDDKNPRFQAVEDGSAVPGVPRLAVLEWIGDNIQDFPHLSQELRNEPESAFARFGESYFALPNAMYGSWQSNPLN
jgi:acid phosphatase